MIDQILKEIEQFRTRLEDEGRQREPADYVIRVCEAIVAKAAGYETRADWRHLQERG